MIKRSYIIVVVIMTSIILLMYISIAKTIESTELAGKNSWYKNARVIEKNNDVINGTYVLIEDANGKREFIECEECMVGDVIQVLMYNDRVIEFHRVVVENNNA